jgi:hypothetical protein
VPRLLLEKSIEFIVHGLLPTFITHCFVMMLRFTRGGKKTVANCPICKTFGLEIPCCNLVPCRANESMDDEEGPGTEPPDCKSCTGLKRDEEIRMDSAAEDPRVKPGASGTAMRGSVAISLDLCIKPGTSEATRGPWPSPTLPYLVHHPVRDHH